ncbi:MAG: alpha-amylase family glycosyl hydrolase [bacterium]
MTNPLRARGNPHLLEVALRPWLARLAARARRPVGLDDVPDSEFDFIRERGYDAVWLMGAWTTGPRARRLALGYPDLLRTYERLVPDWEPCDVAGSPYSIAAYEPPPNVGGRDALRRLRERLHERGLGLVLDFVPNHVGIDHPWLDDHPERLVRGTPRDLARDPSTYFVHPRVGGEFRIFAHGKDPYFPGWTDTAQIDFRRRDARRAMQDLLIDAASLADGLRCDMAMLCLPDVFRRTWGESAEEEPGDFWAEAVGALRREIPDIVLVAEVYWGLESRLLETGFDWVYDKETCDALTRADVAAVRHRVDLSAREHASRLHFLENHDETRARAALGDRWRAAAAVAYGLPGLRFFQEGQEDGRRLRAPVQISRVPDEPPDEECREFYGRLLRFLDADVLHGGAWTAAHVEAIGGGESPPLVASVWSGVEEARLLVANLGATAARATLRWPAPAGATAATYVDVGDAATFMSHVSETSQLSLEVEVPAFGARLLRSRP